MKKFNVLIVTLFVGFSSLALAEADGPDYYSIHGVADNDVLNVRDDANAHAKKIGEIQAGATCVKNLGCQGGLSMNEYMTLSKQQQDELKKQRPKWCHIQYKGIDGWVSGKYLIEGSCENKQALNIKDKKGVIEEEIKSYLRNNHLKNDLAIMQASDRKFQFHQYDLNGDGEKEIFVRFLTPYFCGTGGCTYLVLHNNGELITKLTVTRAPIFIERSKINGWSVLLVKDSGVFKELKYENGAYPSNPSMLPKAPYDAPSGQAVILFGKPYSKEKDYFF